MKNRILASLLIICMLLVMLPVTAAADGADTWDGTSDTSWYNDTNTEFILSTAEKLAGLASLVNGGNNFSGKTIKLAADIDLGENEWIPIGGSDSGGTFKGTFDGQGHTISNLKITKELSNTAVNNRIGFFGRTDSPAVIKNLIIENVDITGSLYVGAVVGYGYTGESIENCTVKGDIAIDAWWYAGVIGGNGYMKLINNCHVIGNDGSYIKGNGGSYIGGIWGFRGEGSNDITNCSVTNLSITGVDRVGGICGIAHYGNEISDCAVSGVGIQAEDEAATTVGLIAGANQGGQNAEADKIPSYVLNNEVSSDTTAYVGDTEVTNSAGTTIGGVAAAETVVGTGVLKNEEGDIVAGNFEELSGSIKTTVENNVNNNNTKTYVVKIGLVGYESLAAAFEAVKDGDTITLLKDIELDSGVSFNKEISFTLDGNGYRITPSESFNGLNAIALGNKAGDPAENSSVYTIKNVVFDGWKTREVVRVQGVNAIIDGCTFQNCEQTDRSWALVDFTYANGTVSNCIFKDNICVKCIDFNSNSSSDTSDAELTVSGCEFTGNECTSVGVIYYHRGDSATISNNKFIDNESAIATVYSGIYGNNSEITGCLFKGNTGNNADAVFAEGRCDITGNAFVDNGSTVDVVYDTLSTGGDLSGNYWGGSKPVEDTNYSIKCEASVDVSTYYISYEINEDGELVLGGDDDSDKLGFLNIPSVSFSDDTIRLEDLKDTSAFDAALEIQSMLLLQTGNFTDVAKSDWFYNDIIALVNKGVINGYPDGSFKPFGEVTWGEALKLVMKAVGYGDIAPTNGHWASGFMAMAIEHGLISGEVDLDAAITREEVANLTAQALKLAPAVIEYPFDDAAPEAAVALYAAGIIKGSADNGQLLFRGESTIIRAEMAAIIWRVYCAR